MKGVVPAAGEGTRLRPLTNDRPKGLVSIDGQPLLTYCFQALCDVGVTELVVIVGYRGEMIEEHYGESFQDVPITYVHQPDQLGLGHAILQAESEIDDDFLVLNGDNVFRGNIEDAVAHQREPGIAATMIVEDVSREEAKTTGVVETTEERVTGMVEKPDEPSSTLVATGCYVLPPAIFHALHLVEPSPRGEYELSDAIDLLATAGATVKVVPLEGWRINVNEAADIDRAERRLQ